jgi:hypothetical protein
LHEIDIGKSLWAFTRKPDRRYMLAAELVISAKTLNPHGYRYGAYRVWGDLRSSRYFAVDQQPDISSLIRSLSIAASGEVLGRSFQGRAAVRRICEADHLALLAYAERVPEEPRARLLPEERLEALLLAGDDDAVARLLHDEPAGMAEERRQYLTQVARRDHELVEHLRELYCGECQICGWAPRRSYGAEICETHHLRWLSRGGSDVLGNLVLLCPNHHRAVHRCDAPFDFGSTAFVFAATREGLRTIRHELQAV